MEKFLIKIRKKFYFIPVLYSIFAMILSLFVIYVDSNYFLDQYNIPRFLLTELDLGVSIFTSLVGALLTMITVTFSTMMVVLTLYSSDLSPRSIQDFLEKKFTTRILGFMSAVFVYSLVSLYAMKESTNGNLYLSPFIGILLAIITIFIFIYFIHQVSKSVRVNLYIQQLTKENIEIIDNKFKESIEDNDITNIKPEGFEDTLSEEPFQIKATESGFIQLYEEKKLWNLALDNNIIIVCERAIGDLVIEDVEIFSVHGLEESDIDKDELVDKLLGMVIIWEDSNKNEDLEAGLKKLVEVGIRALSPGVNDPNTALFCIDNLGLLLSKIGTEFDRQFFLNDEGKAVLVVENTPFVDLLYNVFYQFKLYGEKDNFVIGSLLEALGRIAKANNFEVKSRVWRFARYIVESKKEEELVDMDKSYLNRKISLLAKHTDHSAKELYL
jgi:uncharacterized membrane protein